MKKREELCLKARFLLGIILFFQLCRLPLRHNKIVIYTLVFNNLGMSTDFGNFALVKDYKSVCIGKG